MLHNKKGFTLIELLVVLAILTAMAGLSIPFFQSFQTSSDLYTNTNSIMQTLRRAQQLAIIGKHADDWGVYFDSTNDQLTLFKGNSYSARDIEYDIQTEYGSAFSVTTDFGNEIYFTIYSGVPSIQGTVTVTSVNTVKTETISITSNSIIEIDE